MRNAKKSPTPISVDFETFGIEKRPSYPPEPVGVSIKYWGKSPVYYAWGHASGNNCTRKQALEALKKVWADPAGMVFQNCRFDLDVAEIHLGLPQPSWEQVHDTMLMIFLDDPHARQIGLKPAAARLLGMPADEQDAVADWLIEHQPVEGIKISKSPNGKHPAGAYLSYAPGNVVAPYANGDTIRTEKLFKRLYSSLGQRKMLKAYDRERQLNPILLDMERRGIRVDLDRLRADVALYNDWLKKIKTWLHKRLNVGPEINLDSGAQLLQALKDADAVDLSLMGYTKPSKTHPQGQIKTDKSALAAGITDKQLSAVLQYDTQLKTCLSTFMEPWLLTAEQSGGLIFTTWNSTRSPNGGTRTGRFSSTPNFQNMPKEFAIIFLHEALVWNKANPLEKVESKIFPKSPWPSLPKLPMCRGYIVPMETDHVLVGRDYSQQEPRILAHFEDGDLKEQYIANPWIDYHDNAKDNLERIFQRKFKRKPVKNINLGIIYGQGVSSLAVKNDETYEDTKELKEAILKMYPGLKEMYTDMRRRAIANEPIRTWGGREYYCEPPIIIDGKMKTFDYKMVNVLIQGSAADCTKEAILRLVRLAGSSQDLAKALVNMAKRRWYLVLSVHDELVLSVPFKDLAEAQETARQAMESVEFDVLIGSEGAWSQTNWASMKDYDKKGVILPN